jgi:hypothetical protein
MDSGVSPVNGIDGTPQHPLAATASIAVGMEEAV